MDLRLNYLEIVEKIRQTSPRAKLLAVSKFQPKEKILELHRFGQKIFGENYVQEFMKKKSDLEALDIEWHFIGNLQSNKAKNIVGHCSLIHSVDSVKLFEKINSAMQNLGALSPQKILLQVNLANEDSKFGFVPEDILKLEERLWNSPLVCITGLMTLPPLQNQAEENRIYFKKLHSLFDELNKKLPLEKRLVELSMGTSHDFHIALEEGASIVRLGTMLFGERISS